MAGQFSAAGERLPIRHGVGGFKTDFIPPFTLRSFYFTAAPLLGAFRCIARARGLRPAAFFFGFGGFWVHEPGCIVKAELRGRAPR